MGREQRQRDLAAAFFTPAERERIRQAVVAVEATTSGEIATMVVAMSDRYREAAALGAVLGAALAALVIAIISQHVTIWTFLPLTFLLYFPLRLLLDRYPLPVRSLIGNRRLHDAVRDRAVRAFYEQGLYRTRHETGILIFISLFEHKVWILGDRGINARIAPENWQRLVVALTAGIKKGSACEALCHVIAQCGTELARHFPRESDDVNELADDLLSEA